MIWHRHQNAEDSREICRIVFLAERFRKIVEAYNQETERATIEKTFEALLNLIEGLSNEEQRSVREGLGGADRQACGQRLRALALAPVAQVQVRA